MEIVPDKVTQQEERRTEEKGRENERMGISVTFFIWSLIFYKYYECECCYSHIHFSGLSPAHPRPAALVEWRLLW